MGNGGRVPPDRWCVRSREQPCCETDRQTVGVGRVGVMGDAGDPTGSPPVPRIAGGVYPATRLVQRML